MQLLEAKRSFGLSKVLVVLSTGDCELQVCSLLPSANNVPFDELGFHRS